MSSRDGLSLIQVASGSLSGTPTSVVIVADWRSCRVFSPEVAERARAMLTAPSARIERSALLHSANQPTSVMQVLRLVREANHPARRLFSDTHEMRTWLEEILTPRERVSLGAFLDRIG